MTRPIRSVLVVGLICLAFVAFYPPLKRPSDPKGTANRQATKEWPLGQRSLLLVDDYVYVFRDPANQAGGVDSQIDSARLLGEALLILALTGMGVVLLWPGPSSTAAGN